MKKGKSVTQVSFNGEIVARYKNAAEAGRVTGLNLLKEYPSVKSAVAEGFRQSGISNCCAGRISNHKGYIWKFKQTC